MPILDSEDNTLYFIFTKMQPSHWTTRTRVTSIRSSFGSGWHILWKSVDYFAWILAIVGSEFVASGKAADCQQNNWELILGGRTLCHSACWMSRPRRRHRDIQRKWSDFPHWRTSKQQSSPPNVADGSERGEAEKSWTGSAFSRNVAAADAYSGETAV